MSWKGIIYYVVVLSALAGFVLVSFPGFIPQITPITDGGKGREIVTAYADTLAKVLRASAERTEQGRYSGDGEWARDLSAEFMGSLAPDVSPPFDNASRHAVQVKTVVDGRVVWKPIDWGSDEEVRKAAAALRELAADIERAGR